MNQIDFAEDLHQSSAENGAAQSTLSCCLMIDFVAAADAARAAEQRVGDVGSTREVMTPRKQATTS